MTKSGFFNSVPLQCTAFLPNNNFLVGFYCVEFTDISVQSQDGRKFLKLSGAFILCGR